MESWQAGFERGTTQRRVGDHHRTTMRQDDRPNQGQSQTGTSFIAAPRVLQSDETLKDTGPIRLSDAGPIVLDPQHRPVGKFLQRKGDPAVGMPCCVGDQIANKPGELLPIAQNPHSTYRRHIDDWPVWACCLSKNDVIEIHLDRVWHLALIEASQHQHVIDEPAKTILLFAHNPGSPFPVRLLGVRQGYLELGLAGRNRTAQLV